jgi:hypothetical protein
MVVCENSEKARALHTNGPRDKPRCGALSLIFKKSRYTTWGFTRLISPTHKRTEGRARCGALSSPMKSPPKGDSAEIAVG